MKGGSKEAENIRVLQSRGQRRVRGVGGGRGRGRGAGESGRRGVDRNSGRRAASMLRLESVEVRKQFCFENKSLV